VFGVVSLMLNVRLALDIEDRQPVGLASFLPVRALGRAIEGKTLKMSRRST